MTEPHRWIGKWGEQYCEHCGLSEHFRTGLCKGDNPYVYKYPRPSVTADTVIFCTGHVCLIKRKNEPFKDQWALPGGFMNMDETAEQAAIREVLEETSIPIDSYPLRSVGYWDSVNRDPRGRVITFAFYTIIPLIESRHLKAADDAAEADWFDHQNLPPLAFDHEQIIKRAIEIGTSK